MSADSDKPWKIPSDIPEGPESPGARRVIVVTPYHKEVLGEEAAASWRELLEKGSARASFDDEPSCRRCGSREMLVGRSPFGLTCEACYEGDGLPDYEALGYPETAITEALADFDDAVLTVEVAISTLFGNTSEVLDRLHWKRHQKDIRDATDNG